MTVLSGGIEVIFANGVASGTTVSSGGTQHVYGGGVASGTTIYNGGTEQLLGGTAIGASVEAGRLLVIVE